MPEWCLRFGTVPPRTPEIDAHPIDAASLDAAYLDGAYLDTLREIGRRHGIDHLGVAPAGVMHRARAALQTRKAAGLSDSMEFTYRNPERSTDPGAAVAGARSMLVAARSYALDAPPAPAGPYASVARYAWVDHYAPLRAGLQEIVRTLRSDGYKAVAFADDNSVVDREAAWLGGLGWFGKNANILLPGAGSFFVLGSVITTAPLPLADGPVADGCGTCRRCIDGCPTGAIVAPGVVDAGRCLAWLLQRPGVFPREHRAALGNRIYGCDECQTVCPPTVRFGRRTSGTTEQPVQAWVPLVELLETDDDTVLALYGRWYIADRNPIWLRRNALIALANQIVGNRVVASRVIGHRVVGSDDVPEAVVRVLVRCLAHPDPMLRAHAVWAAIEVGRADLVPTDDTDPLVLDELAAARR
ncbi:MAG: hypothetical protein JWM34_1411 [Ilumatobacteraceae bacterium]|nr:hypothetical protein [Ilumatobacteraceae bacterium]